MNPCVQFATGSGVVARVLLCPAPRASCVPHACPDGVVSRHDFRVAVKDLDLGQGLDIPKPHKDRLMQLIDGQGRDDGRPGWLR